MHAGIVKLLRFNKKQWKKEDGMKYEMVTKRTAKIEEEKQQRGAN